MKREGWFRGFFFLGGYLHCEKIGGENPFSVGGGGAEKVFLFLVRVIKGNRKGKGHSSLCSFFLTLFA